MKMMRDKMMRAHEEKKRKKQFERCSSNEIANLKQLQ